MPFDPYFARDGDKKFTCRGEPRAVYTETEKAEARKMLDLPDGERQKLRSDLFDKHVAKQPLTRPELLFYHTMRKRRRARARRPLDLRSSHYVHNGHNGKS